MGFILWVMAGLAAAIYYVNYLLNSHGVLRLKDLAGIFVITLFGWISFAIGVLVWFSGNKNRVLIWRK